VTVEDTDGTTRAVTVIPGLSTAGGMVEITPVDGDLEAGDRVVVGFQTAP
jgi:threonine dehydrogenase-like Zn-dependent dehydrogenase